MKHSQISPDLLAAYRDTEFWVMSFDRPFCLRVGEHSTELARLLANHSCECAAYITAYNPFSQPRDEAINLRDHERLRLEITRSDLHVYEGEGRDSTGTWPAERSYLILGLDQENSRSIGIQFGQNAIVWSGNDSIPRLIVLR